MDIGYDFIKFNRLIRLYDEKVLEKIKDYEI